MTARRPRPAIPFVHAGGPGYRVVRLPRGRLAVLDLLSVAAARYTVHGLIEADVTAAQQRLRSSQDRPSLTAFVVATLARAVQQHPEVNARRVGRRLVVFDEVDLIVTVERQEDTGPVPIPWRIRHAHDKPLQEIAAELAAARTASASGSGNLARRWGKLPRVARRLGGRLLGRLPSTAARFGPPIGISSLGMFGPGWAIPISPMTLMVTVGGSSRRPVVRDGRLEEREVLPMTLSFDHSVIDGAPAARFAATFRQLLETGAALDTPAAPGRRGNAHDDGNRNALGLPT